MGRLTTGQGFSILAVATMLSVQFGCGGDQPTSPVAEMTPEQMQVAALVESVSDSATGSLNRLRELFTKDNAPKSSDHAKFKDNWFEVDGEIAISGTTASFPVKTGSYTSDTTTVLQWKAEKVGNEWLLSETPLP